MFDQNGFRHKSWILPAIYSGFLVALFLLGQFAALQQTANDEGDRGNDDNDAFALPSLGCLQSLLCEADYFLERRRWNCTSHSSCLCLLLLSLCQYYSSSHIPFITESDIAITSPQGCMISNRVSVLL